MNSIELNYGVTEELLLKNGFTKKSNGIYRICKVVYKSILVLKIYIDLSEKEVLYDIIDRNTQMSYHPFWNDNSKNNLVVLEIQKNINAFIEELQNKKILRRERKWNQK